MADKSLLRMIHLALLGALVFVATYFIKIVMPIGYIHLGDGMVLAGAVLLGPASWIAASLGSALADMLLGYSAYILPTFLIKGLVAATAGILLIKVRRPQVVVLVFVLAEAIMVGGYFAVESFMYGVNGAIPAILPNTLQGVSGVVVAMVLYPVLLNLKKRFNYYR